jgi:hypothetical protein
MSWEKEVGEWSDDRGFVGDGSRSGSQTPKVGATGEKRLWPPEEATVLCELGSGQDGPEQVVLQVEAFDLEALGEGVCSGFDLLFDPDDMLVDLVIFLVEASEVGVARLELDDDVTVFRELAEERVFE